MRKARPLCLRGVPRQRKPNRAALYTAPAYLALLLRVGANVRRLREAQDLTQEELAFRSTDMGPAMLRTIEAGRVNVTALSMSRLAEGLGVDPAELLAPAAPPVKRKRGRPKKEP